MNSVSTTALAPACMLRGVAQRSCSCPVAGIRVPRRETSSWHRPIGTSTSTGAPRSTLTKSSREAVLQDLQDPTEVAAYLTGPGLDEGDSAVFLLALRDVADAHGLQTVASKARRNRANLDRMLSEQGILLVGSLTALLDALNVRLAITVKYALRTRRVGNDTTPTCHTSAAHARSRTRFCHRRCPLRAKLWQCAKQTQHAKRLQRSHSTVPV